MSTLDRRTFLKLAGAGGLVAAGPMQALAASAAPERGRGAASAGKGGYGPLVPTREKDTGELMLHLPEGFQYRAFGLEGTPMSDGALTPGGHDGMAAFPVGRGRFRLIRNQEILPLGDGIPQEAFGRSEDWPHDFVRAPYDPEGPGGCTTLEVDAHGRLYRSWTSLNGTTMNCAGGPMPWGSWISCEENLNGPDANRNFLGQTLDLTERHGYIWEVPVSRGPGDTEASVPIRSAGRFNHEAVAWGRDGSLYLTEDNFDGPSGFYRYVPPNDPRRDGYVADGGRLYILVALDDGQPVDFDLPDDSLVPGWIPRPGGATAPSADLRGEVGIGTAFRTRWVEIPVPDPDIPDDTSNTDASRGVVLQGWLQGAARFSRIEGCWYGDGKVFFNATAGGAPPTRDDPFRRGSGNGQVWSYDIRSGELTVIFESDDADVLSSPDNITFTPQGSLLLCEDGSSSRQQKLVGLTLDGRPFDVALNNLSEVEPWASTGDLGDGSGAEWAGATFAHNGNTLFVNIQADPAVTFAIWGPWSRGAL